MESEIPALIIASPWDKIILENILRSIDSVRIVGKFSDFTSGIFLLDEKELCYIFTELEMSQNDGIGCLELLENKKNVKVAIVSRLLRYCSRVLFDELKKFKPMIIHPMPLTEHEVDEFSRSIIDKLAGDKNEASPLIKSYVLNFRRLPNINGFVTIIGGSTGALASLYKILDILKPNDDSSTVLALHTIKSGNVIEKISRVCDSRVTEVRDSERVELGKVYVLRSGRNYRLMLKRGDLYFRSFKTQLALGYRPSINLIMENFSAIFRERCTGVILSGYGNDGVLGSRLIAMRGGRVIIQDPSTARAPIMPQSTIRIIEELGKHPEILKV